MYFTKMVDSLETPPLNVLWHLAYKRSTSVKHVYTSVARGSRSGHVSRATRRIPEHKNSAEDSCVVSISVVSQYIRIYPGSVLSVPSQEFMDMISNKRSTVVWLSLHVELGQGWIQCLCRAGHPWAGTFRFHRLQHPAVVTQLQVHASDIVMCFLPFCPTPASQ